MKPALLLSTLVLFLSLPVFSASLTIQEEARQFIRLVEACQEGNVEVVRECLDLGVNPERKDAKGNSPMLHAAIYGRLDVVRLLADRGYATDYAALYLAIQSGNYDLVRFLLERGAPTEQPDSIRSLRHPAYGALQQDDPKMLEILEEHGFDIVNWVYYDTRILPLAAGMDAERIVTYLLDRGFDPNKADDKGLTPLICATWSPDNEVLKILLQAGADPNKINILRKNNGYAETRISPLLNAVLKHNLDGVELLLKHGADPSIPENICVIMADMLGNRKIYNRLIAAGAPVPPPHAYLNIIKGYELRARNAEFRSSSSRVLPPAFDMPAEDDSPILSDHVSAPYALAVITESAELRDLETLITSRMGRSPGCTTVERTEIQKVSNELSLTSGLIDRRADMIRAGNLLSADVLLILEEDKEESLYTLVNAKTGYILGQGFYPEKSNLENRATEITARIESLMAKGVPDLEELSLISIPALTPEQGSVEAARLQRWLKQGLTLQLVNQNKVLVLEREEMNKLSFEKSLDTKTQAFFASGWLVDGSFMLGEGDDPVVTLNLRIRQSGNGTEHRVTQRGRVSELNLLLQNTTRELLTVVQDKVPKMLNSTALATEAVRYLDHAKRAMATNQWETAYHNAVAAWALGDHSENATEALLLSMMNRVRESELAILRYKKSAPLRGLAQFTLYRSPLHVENLDPVVMDGEEYFETSNTILDLYSFVFLKSSGFSDFEKDQLMFLPVAMLCTAIPLHNYPSLSDREVYGTEIADLQNRILRLTHRTMEIAKEDDHPWIYMRALFTYLVQLPYLYDDQEALYQEGHRIFSMAENFEYPYEKESVFSIVHYRAIEIVTYMSSYAHKGWSLLAKNMADSELIEERLIGMDLLRYSTRSAEKFDHLTKSYSDLCLAVENRNRTVVSHYWDRKDAMEIPDNPTFRGTYHKLPVAGATSRRSLPYSENGNYLNHLGLAFYRRMVDDFYVKWIAPDPDQIEPWKNNNIAKNYRKGLWYKTEQEKWNQQLDKRFPDRVLLPPPGYIGWPRNPPDDIEGLRSNLEILEATKTKVSTLAKDYGFNPSSIQSSIDNKIKVTKNLILNKELESITRTLHFNLYNFHLYDTGTPSFKTVNMFQLDTGQGLRGIWLTARVKNEAGSNKCILINIDATGGIRQRIQVPNTIKDIRLRDQWMNTGIKDSSNADHLAMVATLQHKMSEAIPSAIGLYDLKEETWKFIDIPELQGKIDYHNDIDCLLLIGDQVVYSYHLNPIYNADSNTHQTKQDASRSIGISSINIHTGQHNPLVQNRRIPEQSPLDTFNGEHYRIVKRDEQSFGIGRHVYTFPTSEWITIEKPLPRMVTYPWYQIDGVIVGISPSNTPGKVEVRFRWADNRKRPVLDLKIDMGYTLEDELLAQAEFMKPLYLKQEGRFYPKFNIQQYAKIHYAYNEYGFCILPTDEVEATLQPLIDIINKKYNEPAVGATPE